MADFKTSRDLIDDIAKELNQLGDDISGKLGQEMLDEGAKIIEFNWVKAIKNHDHVDTGDMVNSIGVRNAEKAFIAHYGKSGQLGSRFVDEAESNSDAECAAAMQNKLDEYLEKKGM